MDYLIKFAWFFLSLLFLGWVVVRLTRKPRRKKEKAATGIPADTEDLFTFGRVNEMIEQERTRIASELHDELGTLLSVIHLDLELVLRESSSLTPYGEARLLEIRKNLNLVIESIRHNIWSLAPQMLDQVQLDFALRELCRKLDAYKGTHLHFVQSGVAFPITHKQKLNLFRVVQELLTNAIKHSSAWNISVQLHWDDDLLTIVVEDDGSAYDETESKPLSGSGGMGATNIIKRVNLIGATMAKVPLSRGTKVTIEMKKGIVDSEIPS
jgi:signal transduction histidine kinase